MKRLDGKVALVTGAGAGIGRSIAGLFAREGARVFINDIDERAIDAAVKEISEEDGMASGSVADVADEAAVRAMMDEIGRDASRLDVLVNNAGIMMRTDFKNSEADNWERVLRVHLQGTVNCTRAAFPLLRAGKNASIINMASIMATKHMRQLSSYSTAKGAIIAFSRSIALEYTPLGIRVNTICPGYVETDLTARFTKRGFIRDFLLQQTPMRRFGQPLEIAKAALFLASDDAAFITGASLTVDGGLSVSL